MRDIGKTPGFCLIKDYNPGVSFPLFFCIIVKIPLDIDNRRTFISLTGGQISQGAQQICQASWCSTLGYHGAFQVFCLLVLFLDVILDGSL